MQLELKRIQRDVGITFVFVTHDQEEALTMSDRIAVMRKGGSSRSGTPEEIYDEPATAFVARFIGSANLIAGGGRAARPAGARRLRAAGRAARRGRRRGGRSFAPGDAGAADDPPGAARGRPRASRRAAASASRSPAPTWSSRARCCAARCATRTATSCRLPRGVSGRQPACGPARALWLSWEPDAARLLHPDATASRRRRAR